MAVASWLADSLSLAQDGRFSKVVPAEWATADENPQREDRCCLAKSHLTIRLCTDSSRLTQCQESVNQLRRHTSAVLSVQSYRTEDWEWQGNEP